MYAVVRTGGKQVRVRPGAAVRVESLAGAVGDTVELGEVLLVAADEGAPRFGTPLLAGARVIGTITAQGRGKKITTFKQKRRKNYRRTIGHRQGYTEIRVDRIEASPPEAGAQRAAGERRSDR